MRTRFKEHWKADNKESLKTQRQLPSIFSLKKKDLTRKSGELDIIKDQRRIAKRETIESYQPAGGGLGRRRAGG